MCVCVCVCVCVRVCACVRACVCVHPFINVTCEVTIDGLDTLNLQYINYYN